MDNRAGHLADQFNQASREFIEAFSGFSDCQMQGYCRDERCTVAALGSHVAGVHRLAADWIQLSAAGHALPQITMTLVDQANAGQFSRDAGRAKDDVLEDLRRNSAQASRLVRGLSDRELDRTSYFALFDSLVSTEDLVRNILIADVKGHLSSLRNLMPVDLSTA